MIRVKQILSNNAVIALDGNHHEIVAIGRGIGFGKKEGDAVDPGAIESQFLKKSGGVTDVINELVNTIPIEFLLVTQHILQLAQARLSIDIQETLIFALSDHINFAVQRYKKDQHIKNMLLWDIKKFYAAEFQIAQQALLLINKKFTVELPEDEAGFIALHLANAKINDMHDTMQSATIIKDILTIIKIDLRINYDETSVNYQRLITHLKFFSLRMLNRNNIDHKDNQLYAGIKEAMPSAWLCASKISHYVDKNYGYPLTMDEKMFLTIHINRLIA